MPHLIGCDIAHRQGVKLNLYPSPLAAWDNAAMSDASDELEQIRERLQRLMDERRIKAKPLARAAGLGETAVRDIFADGRRDVRIGTLVKLADYFGVGIDALLHDEIPVIGSVGAAGEVCFNGFDQDDGVEPDSFVARPPGSSGKLMALRVSGISMFPKYEDGDVVYIRHSHNGVLPQDLGKYCVIRTADGGTWLKTLTLGRIDGRFTLRSLNAPDMEDVEVVWASPVLWSSPGSALS